jgi:hypothetical protein
MILSSLRFVADFKIKVVSNKIARYNHLVGGILMLVIGILMIFFPAILQFNFLS